MKALIILVLLAGCATVPHGPSVVGVADMGKGGSVTLLATPCDGKVAQMIQALKPEFRAGWKSAEGVFFMQPEQKLQRFAGCWMEPPLSMTGGERAALVFFEDGDAMAIPWEKFDGRPAKPAGVDI